MIQTEFEALLSDTTKRILGDINWNNDEDHSPAVEFRVEVESDPGYPIFVKGSYNAVIGTLSYALIHRGSGRVYALDLGKIITTRTAIMSARSTSTDGMSRSATEKPTSPTT